MSTAQAKPTKPKAKLAAPLHPPYLQMITEAISALKERGGSSSQAIGKYLEGKYKTQLPPNFRKLLSVQLRRFAKSAKLQKIKNSFKVGASPAATGEKKPVGRPPKVGAAAKRPAAKAPAKPKAAGEKAAAKPKVAGEKKAVKKLAAAAAPKAVKTAAGKPAKARAAKAAKPATVKKAPKKVKTLKTVKSPAKKKAAPKAAKPAAKKART